MLGVIQTIALRLLEGLGPFSLNLWQLRRILRCPQCVWLYFPRFRSQVRILLPPLFLSPAESAHYDTGQRLAEGLARAQKG